MNPATVVVASNSDLATVVAALLLFVHAIFCVAFLGRAQFNVASTRARAVKILLGCLVAVALTATPMIMMVPFVQAPLALVAATQVVLAAISPIIGVSILIANLIVRPWELLPSGTIFELLPKTIAAVALLGWLAGMLAGRGKLVVWNGFIATMTLFLFWVAISASFNSGGEGLNRFFTTFFPIVAILILLVNSARTHLDLELLRLTLTVALVTVMGVSLIRWYEQPGSAGNEQRIANSGREVSRERLSGYGLWGNANDLAALVTIAAPLLAVRRRKDRLVLPGVLAALGLTVCLAVLIQSESRGAFAALAGAALTAAICSRQRVLALLFSTCLIAAMLFVATFTSSRVEEDLEGSRAARWNYVVTGFRMAAHSPLFGIGLDNFSTQYENYTRDFSEWGKRTAHSSWVLAMSEAGFIGLGLVALMVWTTLRRAWRLRAQAPEWLVLCVSYLITMSLLSHMFLFLPYVVFGYVVVADRVAGAAAA